LPHFRTEDLTDLREKILHIVQTEKKYE